MQLAGKGCTTDANIGKALTYWTDSWHQFLLCQDTSLGATVGQSAYMWNPIIWKSDVYHLLHTCHVYIEVKHKFFSLECLLAYFLKRLCINCTLFIAVLITHKEPEKTKGSNRGPQRDW